MNITRFLSITVILIAIVNIIVAVPDAASDKLPEWSGYFGGWIVALCNGWAWFMTELKKG